MEDITIRSMMGYEHISIPVSFIDNYLTAGGDCIKVYLYLLRAFSLPGASLSFSEMSEKLDMTPNSIKRAIKYWETTGIISSTYSGSAKKPVLKEITFLPITVNDTTEYDTADDTTDDQTDITSASEDILGEAELLDNTSDLNEDVPIENNISECERLACGRILEEFIGPISSNVSEDLNSFIIDELGFSYDMFEQLIDFCTAIKNASKTDKKINFNYIRAIAIEWHEKGLNTSDKIKNYFSDKNKNKIYTLVKEYLGLDSLAKQESILVDSWIFSLSYGEDVIKEACIIARNQRKSVDRADLLLNTWYSQKLYTLSEIKASNAAHWEEINSNITKASSAKKTVAPVTQFNSFTQRKTDYNKKIDYSL